MHKNFTTASNSFFDEHYRWVENTFNILNFTIFQEISSIHKMIRMVIPTNISSAIYYMSDAIVS